MDVQDNYPKFVVSMDKLQPRNREGIEWRNIVDFIRGDEF